jgi:hypothetical protein
MEEGRKKRTRGEVVGYAEGQENLRARARSGEGGNTGTKTSLFGKRTDNGCLFSIFRWGTAEY